MFILLKSKSTHLPASDHRYWVVNVKTKMRHHMSNHLPESFSLASILAEQGMHHQEGLSQNDWLQTTRKLIPSP